MVLLDGFATGLLLQLAIGPVFFLIVDITVRGSTAHGLVAVLAVTLADSLYILLAAVGVGKLLERRRAGVVLRIAGSAVLAAFGVAMVVSALRDGQAPSARDAGGPTALSAFLGPLTLTLSSPLTVVFWTGLFAAKAAERGYSRRQLIPFGIGAGLATVAFLSLAVIAVSAVRASIPTRTVGLLNGAVGIVLVAYAATRLVKALRP